MECQKDVIFVDVAAGVSLDDSSSSRRPLGLAGMFVSRSLLGSGIFCHSPQEVNSLLLTASIDTAVPADGVGGS